MNKKKYGVIIARLQPIHNGHLVLVEDALKTNDYVLLLVGSADKLNKRNPIPVKMRWEMAEQAIIEKFGEEEAKRVIIVALDDLTDESDNSHDWGFYLYTNIVKYTNNARFSIYYSDGFEIIMSWFPPFVTKNFVSFILLARGGIYDNLSATKVRSMIVNGLDDELKEAVPACVYEKRAILRQFIDAYFV